MSDQDEGGEADPLGFTTRWYSLGIVDMAMRARLHHEWSTSDDRNPEHYRYGAFTEYLKRAGPLEQEVAVALYQLGEADHDVAMGGAMMADVLRRPECPQVLLDLALTSERRHLARIVQRRRR